MERMERMERILYRAKNQWFSNHTQQNIKKFQTLKK